MKKENILVVALICLGIAGIFFYNSSRQDRFSDSMPSTDVAGDSISQINWTPFEQGFSLAREQNRPVFLYFYADWCSFCTKLKKTTFQDKAVLAYLSQNFISIKVDTDKERQLATDWRVTGLPTMWFLDSEGTRINAIPGYVDEKTFLNVLKYHSTNAYKNMNFQDFVKTL